MSRQIIRAITVVFQEDTKIWTQLHNGPIMAIDVGKGKRFEGVPSTKQIEKLNNVCIEAFDFFLPNGSVMIDVPYESVMILE